MNHQYAAYVYVQIEEVIFAPIPIVPELLCADVMYPAAVPAEQVVAVVQMSAVFQPVPWAQVSTAAELPDRGNHLSCASTTIILH